MPSPSVTGFDWSTVTFSGGRGARRLRLLLFRGGVSRALTSTIFTTASGGLGAFRFPFTWTRRRVDPLTLALSNLLDESDKSFPGVRKFPHELKVVGCKEYLAVISCLLECTLIGNVQAAAAADDALFSLLPKYTFEAPAANGPTSAACLSISKDSTLQRPRVPV